MMRIGGCEMKKYWLNVFIGVAILLMCGLASSVSAIDISTGQPEIVSVAKISSNSLSNIESQNCAALWDISHGVYLNYEPSLSYSDFVALLASKGYPVAATTNGFLSEDLSQFKILIISTLSTDDSPYTPDEVAAIKNFVDNGGKLLIMGDNTDTPNEHINPVSQAFGTTTGVSFLQPADLTLTNLNVHPAFTGVSSVYLRAAGELSAVAPSETIAWTNAQKAAINVAKGNRVVIIGDSNLFDNVYIVNADNQLLASNLWKNVFCPSPIPSPEFPSAFLPATMIIGFLGAVLLIQRTREH